MPLKFGMRKRVYALIILIFFSMYYLLSQTDTSISPPAVEPQQFLELKDDEVVLMESLFRLNTSSPLDFRNHGEYLRLFQHLYNNQDLLSDTDIAKLSKVTQHLFPWISEKLISKIHKSSSNEQGIVICGYDGGFHLTITLVKIIRQVLKSNMSIEIFYVGNRDLSETNQAALQAIPNVKTVDITKLLNNNLLKLERWAIKPFALLASSFGRVILMDCDVVLFQPPEEIFNDPGFRRSGTLFFHDRSMNDEIRDWARARQIATDLAGELTPTMSALRFFIGKTNYEQESGLVAIDKQRNLMGVLAICSLNTLRERQVLYEVTYGEKETFWMGFEAVHMEYEFNNHFAGVIGRFSGVTPNRICCKQILHLDYLGKPLWMNGGLYFNKKRASGFVNLENYGVETDAKGGWVWDEGGVCLDLLTPHALDSDQLEIVSSMKQIS